MKIEGDTLILSTGKEVYVHDGKIGLDLSNSGTADRLVFGSDGSIAAETDSWVNDLSSNVLTRDEQKELADHMIAAWTAYREAL